MHRGQHLPFLRLIHLLLDKTVHPMWLQLLRAQYILQQVRRQMGKGVLMLRLRKPGMNLHCCCWQYWLAALGLLLLSSYAVIYAAKNHKIVR